MIKNNMLLIVLHKYTAIIFISAIFYPHRTSAVAIESSSPGQVTAKKNASVGFAQGAIYTFALKASADGSAERDTAAEQCIDIMPGSTMGTGTAITGWGALTDFLSGNTLNYTAYLSNHCNYELRRYVGLWSTRQQEVFSGDWITIAANRTCSVDVVTAPEIPVLVPGKPVNEIKITSATVGTGKLAFKPNAVNGSKGVLSDGQNQLTYSVTPTQWDGTTGQWAGALGDYFLKLDDIQDLTTPGQYKGNLTVTISCE